MTMLGRERNVVFLGQGLWSGTTMSATLKGVPDHKKLEMPVAEELQMGMAIGMALDGMLPICIFPRWNFMLRAADQLVNHLDRLPLYSDGGYRPKVIIRTAVPSKSPFNPGPQHDDDFSGVFEFMFRTVHIMRMSSGPYYVTKAYRDALESKDSWVIVEHTEDYKDERGKS